MVPYAFLQTGDPVILFNIFVVVKRMEIHKAENINEGGGSQMGSTLTHTASGALNRSY